ncbi:MAG: DNA repair protein RadA [Phycisphaerae bacterium]|nr:DNA repair protein RadA [Phycisphaerae bacterium]
MSKQKSTFCCTECGAMSPTWMGKCSHCSAWDTIVEKVEIHSEPNCASAVFATTVDEFGGSIEAIELLDIEAPNVGRLQTGIGELDRVLGGGLVVGGVVLVGGDPGIGKSTLMMQSAIGTVKANEEGTTVLYATSEESAYQCKMRGERVVEGFDNASLKGVYLLADTDLERITAQVLKIRPKLLIIDSIQMVYRRDLNSTPGSVSQIKRCCLELVYLARKLQMAVMIVGHVTKEGQLAGPRVLEHLVDVVLNFEGDRHYALRGLRGAKNRFGTTLEIGLFEMGERGLIEVEDAAAYLDPEAPPRAGAIVCPALHGSRCLLIEVQALVASGTVGQARRRSNGLDGARLPMLIAVLEQHAQLEMNDKDIYTSTVGGLKLIEPAVDLAVCTAMMSGAMNIVLPSNMCAIGEVGLGGEIRSVPQIEQRIAQARRRGYKSLLVPITQEKMGGSGCIGMASIGALGAFLQKNANRAQSKMQLSDGEKKRFTECY